MTAKHYGLIVVGLGAMGSAALYQACKRGVKALGIDRFTPPHTMGSSHGDTRITRNAIGEGEVYMPFVKRSNEIWRDLEAATGSALFHQSGGLIIGGEKAVAFHYQGDFVDALRPHRRQIRHRLRDPQRRRAAGALSSAHPRAIATALITSLAPASCARNAASRPSSTWRGGMARSSTPAKK